MTAHKNRVTKEIIDSDVVSRRNGNNCTRGYEAGTAGRRERRPAFYITKAQKARARKASKEREFTRRYLGG